MHPTIVNGNIINQEVEIIINSWNRNIIPWWLLLPQGVSGAIKKKGGISPFIELGKHGVIPLGGAVLSNAGKLPFKGIIHVAGINMFWRASEYSIRNSIQNSMKILIDKHFSSAAYPIIGAGSGGFNTEKALEIMLDEFKKFDADIRVIIVKYKKT